MRCGQSGKRGQPIAFGNCQLTPSIGHFFVTRVTGRRVTGRRTHHVNETEHTQAKWWLGSAVISLKGTHQKVLA